jgi:HD-GYP domain-containing protein (c-di-GMP phosphodiesterase class II)
VTKAYIYGLSAVALAALAWWLYVMHVPFGWVALVASGVLAMVCAVCRRLPLQFGRITFEVVDVAVLAALVFLGPVWAMVVAVPSVLYREPLRMAFSAATHVTILLAAGYVFHLFAEPLLWSTRFDPSLVYGTVASGATYYALDALINTTLLRIKYGTPVMDLLRDALLMPLPSNAATILTALGAAYALVAFSPAAALVLFCGAAGALASLYHLFQSKREIEALGAEVKLLEAENSAALSSPLTFAKHLVEAIERKDGYTARHAAASALYAADVAKDLGLENARVDKLRVAALLQDVGLVSVPDEVLLTPPKKRNSVGRMHLEQHPLWGERMLSCVPGFEEAARWVRWHHEREDGTGYPDRLRGKWIPVEAKVLATVSLYASLILDGQHSPGLPQHEARRELVNLAGKELDRDVVRTFLRILDANDENYASASDDRFTSLTATGLLGRDYSSDEVITPSQTGTSEIH